MTAVALLRTCHPPSSLRSQPPLRRLDRFGPRNPPASARTGRATRAMTAAATAEGLRKGISEFYDESSGLWESIWGDHMHHGYYGTGEPADLSDHRSAQIRMVEEALRFAGVGSEVAQPISSNDLSKRESIVSCWATFVRCIWRPMGLGLDFLMDLIGSALLFCFLSTIMASKMDAVLRASGHCPFLSLHDAPYGTVQWQMAAVAEREVSLKKKGDGKSSETWGELWGEHVRRGFYELGAYASSAAGHRLAQVRLMEEALAFAKITDDSLKKPKTIVDVGCGIGGSSRYLAKKFGANCCGITLSPVQAQRAQALAAAEGLRDKVSFQVADALNQPFPDGQFDLVWSMESGEHMPDKMKFVSELERVAAPGATIIIVTWCHRDLSPDEESLKPEEKNLLNKICSAYYLPDWCSASDYIKIAQSLKLQDIKTADWSENVAPFWPAVIRSALTWRGFTSLLRTGWKTIRGAFAMPLMIEGYNKNLIKFAIITCRKPE